MSEGYQGEKSALIRLVCNRSIHDYRAVSGEFRYLRIG